MNDGTPTAYCYSGLGLWCASSMDECLRARQTPIQMGKADITGCAALK